MHFQEAGDGDDDEAVDIDTAPLPLPYFQQMLVTGSQPGSVSYKVASGIETSRLRKTVFKLHQAIKALQPKKVSCAQQVAVLNSMTVFQQSEEYKASLGQLFNNENLTETHYRLGYRLSMAVYQWIIQAEDDTLPLSTPSDKSTDFIAALDTDGDSCAKLRYVGGSVIGRLLYRKRRAVRDRHGETSFDVRTNLAYVKILKVLAGNEDDLLDPDKGSMYPGSLSEIKDRKYGKLTFLSDACYEFFVLLEKHRLQNLTVHALIEIGGNLPGKVTQAMCNDPELTKKWLEMTLPIETNIFFKHLKIDQPLDEAMPKSVTKRLVQPLVIQISQRATMLHELKSAVIQLFMKSADKNFQQQVKRTLKVEASAAHRVKITQRQKKRKEKAEKRKQVQADKNNNTSKRAKPCSKEEDSAMSITSQEDSASLRQSTVSTDIESPLVTSRQRNSSVSSLEIDHDSISPEETAEEEGQCNMCNIDFQTPNIDWISCDGCQHWVCKPCTGLGKSGWTAVTEKDDPWICIKCRPFCYSCEVVLGAAYYICFSCNQWICKSCSHLNAREWREAIKSKNQLCCSCKDRIETQDMDISK